MKSFARGVEQPQFLCMHSPGRELIVTEMHQSPARLHGATLDQVHGVGPAETGAELQVVRGFVKTSFSDEQFFDQRELTVLANSGLRLRWLVGFRPTSRLPAFSFSIETRHANALRCGTGCARNPLHTSPCRGSSMGGY
jgi:hypothetical protein